MLLQVKKGPNDCRVLEVIHKQAYLSKPIYLVYNLRTACKSSVTLIQFRPSASRTAVVDQPQQKNCILWCSVAQLWAAWKQCPAVLLSWVSEWSSMGMQLFLNEGFVIFQVWWGQKIRKQLPLERWLWLPAGGSLSYHTGPQEGARGNSEQEYCGFPRKEWVRQGKQACDWILGIISMVSEV